jgi:hypothetical protein
MREGRDDDDYELPVPVDVGFRGELYGGGSGGFTGELYGGSGGRYDGGW